MYMYVCMHAFLLWTSHHGLMSFPPIHKSLLLFRRSQGNDSRFFEPYSTFPNSANQPVHAYSITNENEKWSCTGVPLTIFLSPIGQEPCKWNLSDPNGVYFLWKTFMFKLLIIDFIGLSDKQIESHSQNIGRHHSFITKIDIRMTVKSGFSCIKIIVLDTIDDFPTTTRRENCFSKSIHTLLLMCVCGDRVWEKSTLHLYSVCKMLNIVANCYEFHF